MAKYVTKSYAFPIIYFIALNLACSGLNISDDLSERHGMKNLFVYIKKK
jgi:hypothetical protein